MSFQNVSGPAATIVYNITTQVEKSIATKWIDWMLDIHIPEIIGTGNFIHHQVLKLLGIDENESVTYAVQFYAATKKDLDDYLLNHAAAMNKKSHSMWGDRVISFSTTMQVVN
jgi:hypothetical protein